MTTSWTYSAPIGLYKNHYISNKLLYEAVEEMKLMPFTAPVPDFGKGKGESVTLMHIKHMDEPASAELSEDTRIPIDTVEMGERKITLVEMGRGVEYTHLFELLSKFDIKNEIQKALKYQMVSCLDTAAAAAFKHTDVKVIFIPTSLTGGTWDLDGTPTAAATCNMTFDHCGVISDYMQGDLHIPPYESDNYVGIFSRKPLRGLKQDPLWQQVHMYLKKGELFFKGEQGMAESIRFVEVNREKALSNKIGTGNITGEGIIFGSEGVARVEAEAPHLRLDPNFQGDFGRTQAAAWYGVIKMATIWDTADDMQAKIVRWASA
jgi:N4-gp56 family major capsid protein